MHTGWFRDVQELFFKERNNLMYQCRILWKAKMDQNLINKIQLFNKLKQTLLTNICCLPQKVRKDTYVIFQYSERAHVSQCCDFLCCVRGCQLRMRSHPGHICLQTAEGMRANMTQTSYKFGLSDLISNESSLPSQMCSQTVPQFLKFL